VYWHGLTQFMQLMLALSYIGSVLFMPSDAGALWTWQACVEEGTAPACYPLSLISTVTLRSDYTDTQPQIATEVACPLQPPEWLFLGRF
jgi:hypothetical protein